MRYLSRFENFSTDYYLNFNEDDFPKSLSFENPQMVFSLTEIIPGSNKIFIKYIMESDQPGIKNPYSGDMSEEVTIDIGITYKESNTKMYITIIGGNRSWWSFSYECGIVEDIETSDIKLSDNSIKELISVLSKYSSI